MASFFNQDSKYDLFFSYNWQIKEKVRLLYTKLKEEYNYQVWMDDHSTDGSGNLMKQIITGLNQSTCAICFITKKYSESKHCITELTYIYQNDIPFIVLMMEDIRPKDLHEVGLMITPKTRLNFSTEQNPWSSEKFELLLKSVEAFVPNKKSFIYSDDESLNYSFRSLTTNTSKTEFLPSFEDNNKRPKTLSLNSNVI